MEVRPRIIPYGYNACVAVSITLHIVGLDMLIPERVALLWPYNGTSLLSVFCSLFIGSYDSMTCLCDMIDMYRRT